MTQFLKVFFLILMHRTVREEFNITNQACEIYLETLYLLKTVYLLETKLANIQKN